MIPRVSRRSASSWPPAAALTGTTQWLERAGPDDALIRSVRAALYVAWKALHSRARFFTLADTHRELPKTMERERERIGVDKEGAPGIAEFTTA